MSDHVIVWTSKPYLIFWATLLLMVSLENRAEKRDALGNKFPKHMSGRDCALRAEFSAL